MAGKINLNDYEPVEERLIRFRENYPHYRIQTELVEHMGNIGATRWVMKATIWKHKDDEKPAATGWAFEVDGKGMAQATAALETCETSAIGRALANLGYVGNKRVTRSEMRKVKVKELDDRIKNAQNPDELREIWNDAQQNNVLDNVREQLMNRNKQLQQPVEENGNAAA